MLYLKFFVVVMERVQRYAIIAVLALITYLFVYIISNYAMHGIAYNWRFESGTISANYALMPLFGFVLVFFGLSFWKKRFGEKNSVMATLFAIFVLLSLAAFGIVLWFFYIGNANLIFGQVKNQFNSVNKTPPKFLYSICASNCNASGFSCFLSQDGTAFICQVNFWSELFRSSFFLFWLAGIFAGISFFFYEFLKRLLKEKQ